MTHTQENPYMIELHGGINGKPHTIVFDVREVLTRQAALRGDDVSASALDEQAMQAVSNHQRLQSAPPSPVPPTLPELIHDQFERVTTAARHMGTTLLSKLK
jgi:hypothetical protein